MDPERLPAIGLLFIVSCYDSSGLVLCTDYALIMMFSLFDMAHCRQVDSMFIKCVSLCVPEQKDQEEVRRRFASITYSDPLYWDRPGPGGTNTD